VVLATLALALTGWAYSHYRTAVGWNQVLTDLASEPGLVVLDAKSATPGNLHGLRDPLARNPRVVIGTDRLRSYGIVDDWKPYLSLDPTVVLARAEHLLIPPASLILHLEQDALRATGTAPASWLRDARIRAPLIPGVATFDTSAVAVDNQSTFASARDKLNAVALYFNTGSHDLSDADLARFDDIAPSIVDLRDSAAALQVDYRVDVVGRADAPGTTEHNLQLSQSRADAVREALIAHGMSPQRVHARGIGASDGASGSALDSATATAYNQFLNSDRRVNLTVVVKMPASRPQ
jgi:OOP family OmpA-OmpF porin